MNKVIATFLEISSAVYLLVVGILLLPGVCIAGIASKLRPDDTDREESFEEAAARLAGTNDPVKVALMMKMMR